jgi:TolB-like protein/DNA-binding winged helix-turn-helix (wHTH) protein/tetratricopeptide (TPR) repeat protein
MQPSERTPLADCYQIGDLLVDTAEQSVRRSGVELPLPRLSYELLLALIRAHPRMLSNDDLLTSVWTPAIVNPETVSQRVKLLRYALGDDDVQNPRYIARVRGRGYRLIAPVTLHASASSPMTMKPTQVPAESPQPTAPAIRPPTRRPLIITGRAAVALATIGFAAWWQARHYTSSSPPPSMAVAALAGKTSAKVPKSIAVLPFLDLTEKRDEAFFADGMTEEITSLLSQAADLRVSARTSAFYFKDHPMSVGDIGNALGVANVLEGSVRKSGNRVRITVQLIRTDTGFHTWSASYERPADDLFGTQTEIANSVVSHLQATFDVDSNRHDPLGNNPKARNLLLQASAELGAATPAGSHDGIKHLQEALAADPQFALAWAVLANARLDSSFLEDVPPSQAIELARQAVDRALAIDPGLPFAHAINARVLFGEWNVREAVSEVHRALEADPNSWPAMLVLEQLESFRGNHEEAVRVAREAVARDPLNPLCFLVEAGTLLAAGHYQDAVEAYRGALALNPGATYYRFGLAAAQIAAGDATAALTSIESSHDDLQRGLLRPVILDMLGRHTEADREQAEAERKYPDEPHELALLYAYRADADRAMPLLERFYKTRGLGPPPKLEYDPLLRNLRSDPRFQALTRQINIPD